MENICLSGGAQGADTLLGNYALSINHSVIHFSFDTHNSKVNSNLLQRLKDDLLFCKESTAAVKKASKSLKRNLPKNLYIKSLLHRSYFQIKDSSSLYAIAKIVNNQILGGTAWAIQMYIDKNKYSEHINNIYVYNMLNDKVYTYKNCRYEEITSIPNPSGTWTGIGSREATEKHLNNFISYFK